MTVGFTKSFDKHFCRLSSELHQKTRKVIEEFIDCYALRRFPKGLRVHKCGPFLSLSISSHHRIFVLPIPGGIKFVFVGDHRDAEDYLKRS